jgi:hypothetical protein
MIIEPSVLFMFISHAASECDIYMKHVATCLQTSSYHTGLFQTKAI